MAYSNQEHVGANAVLEDGTVMTDQNKRDEDDRQRPVEKSTASAWGLVGAAYLVVLKGDQYLVYAEIWKADYSRPGSGGNEIMTEGIVRVGVICK